MDRNIFIASGIVLALCLSACKRNQDPTGMIEKTYAAPGGEVYSETEIYDNSGGNLYRIYYPQNLNAGRPVVVWGNGTGAQPKNYEGIFRHLASWGFVVIDTYSKTTGTGAEILAAAEYIVHENEVAASVFYHKLDVAHVGAVGHSQGATGVINAHTRYPGGSLIKTVVPIALPALKWSDADDKKYSTADITSSLFIMGGGADGLISPVKSNREAFDNTHANLPAAMGIAIGSGHNAILDNGGRHRGYLTAWLRYRLTGDDNARAAFLGEIQENKDWKDVQVKNIQ